MKNQNRNKALLKKKTQKLNSAAYLSCLLSHISVPTCIRVPPEFLVTQRCYCSTRYSYVAAQWSVGQVVGGLMLKWSSFICCQTWHSANYTLRCGDDVIGEVCLFAAKPGTLAIAFCDAASCLARCGACKMSILIGACTLSEYIT